MKTLLVPYTLGFFLYTYTTPRNKITEPFSDILVNFIEIWEIELEIDEKPWNLFLYITMSIS